MFRFREYLKENTHKMISDYELHRRDSIPGRGINFLVCIA
jgi:hypothetical protein